MLKVDHIGNDKNLITFQKYFIVFVELIHRLETFLRCFAECITLLIFSSVCVIQGLALFVIWMFSIDVLVVLSLRSLVGLLLELYVFFHTVLIHCIDDS